MYTDLSSKIKFTETQNFVLSFIQKWKLKNKGQFFFDSVVFVSFKLRSWLIEKDAFKNKIQMGKCRLRRLSAHNLQSKIII